MYNSKLTALVLASLLCCLSGCGGGGGGGSPASSPVSGTGDTTASSLQGALNNAVNRGVDGLMLTVLKPGNTESYAAGTASRASGEPMDTNGLFKIASVSKLFLAVAVVQAQEQGLLALDDSLSQHLPDLADRIANSDQITLRHMIQHRSGIPDFDSQFGFSWENAHTDTERVLNYALDLPADFAPDSRFEYSNTNYLLLGLVLDSALNYSHHDFIQAEILDPLALRDTYHLQTALGTLPLVRGYWNDVDTTNRLYLIAGGAMVSTPRDVAVFLDALARSELLSDAAQAIYEDVYWLEHSGWVPGYQTIARYESRSNATVVLHMNTTGGNSEEVLSETYDRIISILRR